MRFIVSPPYGMMQKNKNAGPTGFTPIKATRCKFIISHYKWKFQSGIYVKVIFFQMDG